MPADRQIAIDLIDEAVTAGARCLKACAMLEVDVRTVQRWSDKTRNSNPVEKVWLNSPQEHQAGKKQESKAA